MGVAGRLEKTEGAAMKQYEKMSIQELLREDGFLCSCGKRHYAGVEQVYVEENAQVAYYARLLGCARALPPQALAAMAEKLRAGGAV